MSWLIAVLVGHLINAVAYIIDKVLLTKSIKEPFAYTFFIGVLGLFVLVLIPFGFEMPARAALLLIDLASGIFFTLALFFFFQALQSSDASRIVPFVGGAIPLFTIIFEALLLGSHFTSVQFFAFAVLIAGTVVIARDDNPHAVRQKSDKNKKLERSAWGKAFAAALFFATAFGFTKIAYNTQPFLSAFIWSRLGAALPVLILLVIRANRIAVRDAVSIFKEKAGFIFLVGQGLGATGFIFINYAISLTSVSVVNALQGVQYAFLLIIAVIASLKYPNILKESMTRRGLMMKIGAVVLIGVGLYFIAAAT